MAMPEARRPRGPRIHDLVGLVVGYGMAALLARSFWPKSRPLVGLPAVALAFEFCWLGLAMSGPIILLLDRRGGPSPDLSRKGKRLARPGRLVSSKEPAEVPVGRGPAGSPTEPPPSFTRAELAWMVIGGYWIGLTMFVVPALSVDTPWALVGLLQIVAALGLWLVVPRRLGPGGVADSWTHPTAVGLIATWPIAWICLILLSKSF
jgi:hypothetical protein